MKDQHARADHPFYKTPLGTPPDGQENSSICDCPKCVAMGPGIEELTQQLTEVLNKASERPEMSSKVVTVVLMKMLAAHVAMTRVKTFTAEAVAVMLMRAMAQEYMQAHAFMVKEEARQGVAG